MCENCGRELAIACAEQLPDGAGTGDFDACLEIIKGPDGVGRRIFLGGVVDLPVGRADASSIRLAGGKLVSRHHCTICRIDLGPSRWRLADNKSTNGLFLNGRRVSAPAELNDGDVIGVGEYELRYAHADDAPPVAQAAAPAALQHFDDEYNLAPPPLEAAPAARYIPPPRTVGVATAPLPRMSAVAARSAPPADGDPCPSCQQRLPRSAKICVACGIKVPTGRPVILSSGDEDVIHGNAYTFIRIASWPMPLTLFPMPLASEAYGKHKPYATWGIIAFTTLVSLIFFIASWGTDGWDVPGKNLQLWPPGDASITLSDLKMSPRQFISELDEEELAEFNRIKERLRGKVPDEQLDSKAADEFLRPMLQAALGAPGTFYPHQLVTHALLHDTSSILGFILHLMGNMIFLLCFGGRINAIFGNIATLILYPILAIAAAACHLVLGEPRGPMLGASGAVFGFAGMYLILFPIHQVYCGVWLRVWFRFQTWLWYKVFTLRGFWVLLIYFAYDVLMVVLKAGSGTAHWAHLGGFAAGVVLALGILASRLMYCGGGDLLSVILGRHAWPLIGRPARWNKDLVAA